jgi:Zn-dependent metalloprotease
MKGSNNIVLFKRKFGIPNRCRSFSNCMGSGCFIIPEYVNKKIVEKGNKKQKEQAWKNLILTEQLRGRRLVTGLMSSMFSVSNRLNRTIFSAQNKEELPGIIIMSEVEKQVGIRKDRHVSEAFLYSGSTYDFYKKNFDRNSIDTYGMRLDSTVHYGEYYNNAFWNGTQMVYGDGDKEIFERFTKCIDIVGHELTHGITQYEAALEYHGQSGALNESFSDIFGSMIKQWANKQKVDKADWLIGQGVFTEKINGKALRSMKEPGTAYDDPIIGKDPQPGHWKNYDHRRIDNNGVHINSGIPNRAFYLIAMELGGYSWEKAGKIWYVALRDKLQERSNFKMAAKFTFDVAGELYGRRSKEQNAVKKGWNLVGIEIITKN